MVVDLKPAEVKNEDGKKKQWTDFVPISTPEARKKSAAVGCGTVLLIVAIVGLVVMVLGVVGYFSAEAIFSGDSTRANIYCERDYCRDAYINEHLHGQDICEVNEQKIDNIYDDWMDLVDGKQVQCREYIRKRDGVYHMEVEHSCDALPTIIVVDTNNGHSVVKAEKAPGDGYLCMMFQNEDFMGDTLTEVDQFEYDPDVEEYDIRINRITSSFFNFDRPVNTEERAMLSDEVKNMCPEGGIGFYHMRSSDPEFRSRVQELMDLHDIEYDDIFDFFTDIYVALMDEDGDALDDIMDDYLNVVGFLPTGYISDVSTTGIGWGLNINVYTWYYYDYTTQDWVPFANEHISEFHWWEGELVPGYGTRRPEVDEDDNEGDRLRRHAKPTQYRLE